MKKTIFTVIIFALVFLFPCQCFAMDSVQGEKYTIKKPILWILLATILMLVLPWAVKSLCQGTGMMFSLFLFYCINPLFCIFCGVFAGKREKVLWYLPFITALMFLAGANLFFEWGESAFLIYAAFYLVVGLISMLVGSIVWKNKCTQRDSKNI